MVNLFDVDIILLVLNLFSIVLGHLLSMPGLLLGVVEGTDLRLIASRSIAIDSFVLVWVVETLNCGVTFVAKEPIWTLFPTVFRVWGARHVLAVFSRVLENLRRPSEVPHMVSVDARL